MSGVLIKGMEMPSDCMSCPLLTGDGCAVTRGVWFNMVEGWRRDDCPLVPIQNIPDSEEDFYEFCKSALMSGRVKYGRDIEE